MSQLFDAHVRTESSAQTGIDPNLHGALLFGTGAAEARTTFRKQSPSGIWRHAEAVGALIGPGDPRYPANSPDVIDLNVNDAEMARLLGSPLHTWYPLAGNESPRAIRLHLPANGGPIPLVKKLVRGFPRMLFLVDAFRHGPRSGWIPLVRLAECPNVFVTTLGMLPATAPQWTVKADVEAAIYYLIGEVGAGKLLFASGSSIVANNASDYLHWIESIAPLDKEQQRLVAWTNAAEIFSMK